MYYNSVISFYSKTLRSFVACLKFLSLNTYYWSPASEIPSSRAELQGLWQSLSPSFLDRLSWVLAIYESLAHDNNFFLNPGKCFQLNLLASMDPPSNSTSRIILWKLKSYPSTSQGSDSAISSWSWNLIYRQFPINQISSLSPTKTPNANSFHWSLQIF